MAGNIKVDRFLGRWDGAKAYVVGFFQTDGHLGRYKDSGKWRCDFASSDWDVIARLANYFKFTGKISKRKNKGLTKGGKEFATIYQFTVINERLAGEFRRLGFVERKSLEMVGIPAVPDEWFFHYLRGVIDGDGSFGRLHKSIRIVSGRREVLDGINGRLRELGFAGYQVCRSARSFSLQLYSRVAKEIVARLYAGEPELFLGRKKKLAEEIWAKGLIV